MTTANAIGTASLSAATPEISPRADYLYSLALQACIYCWHLFEMQRSLHGADCYMMRFTPGKLPPVDAFWSITLYRASDYLLVGNPIERYSIGDRTAGLVRDADGGLTLRIQHAAPKGAMQHANWLPAPDDAFFLCLRAYLPKPEMVDGRYQLPEPERLD